MRSTSADRSIYGYYNGIAWGFGNLWGFPEPVEHLKERRDVEALLLLLEDPGRRVASAAAETLAQFGERRAVEPLYRRLHAMGRGPFEEPEWSEWTHLSVALAWLERPGSPWADELLALLELGDSRVGWSAGFLLAKMGDCRAIDPIVRCLATADPAATNTPDIVDEDWKWDNLVPALGELKAVEGVDVLSAALPVAHWSIQELIAYALMDIGDTRAVPALVAQLGARHGFYGAAENAIWDALDNLDAPEARSATAAYKRSLDEARPKRRRFWPF